ncbi:hypothetical protein POVWA1_002450 [Plasmodium ovale wallikeri]|uniref:Transmembrane protein n=1 Tax=Plasmodium ovale wallikeri TaxID=864142 RepID=A0A1A8YGA8_PLAOA|nr:hypothetical protein POVWA1_002450 [Plasmodium ovale wallikeri]
MRRALPTVAIAHYAVRTELRNAKGHPSVHVGKPLSYSFVHRASAIFCSIIFKSKTNSVLPSPQKGMRAIKHFKVPKGIASPTLPRLRYCTCVTAPALPRLRYRAYVTASYSLLFFFFFLAIFPAYALRFTCIFRKTYPFLSEFSERILTLQGVPILRKKKKKNEGMGFFRPYSICTPNYHLLPRCTFEKVCRVHILKSYPQPPSCRFSFVYFFAYLTEQSFVKRFSSQQHILHKHCKKDTLFRSRPYLNYVVFILRCSRFFVARCRHCISYNVRTKIMIQLSSIRRT